MSYQLLPVEESHLSWLRNQRNRPEIMEFCRQPYLLNSINQEDWLKKVSRDRSMIPFIVAEDKEWIGYAAFSNIDWIAKRGEFSVFMMPEKANQGKGEAAIRLLLDYGFLTLGFQKIHSDTFDYNKKEQELLKSMGFVETGRLPRHYFKRGTLIDSVCFAIYSENYTPSKSTHYESKPL